MNSFSYIQLQYLHPVTTFTDVTVTFCYRPPAGEQDPRDRIGFLPRNLDQFPWMTNPRAIPNAAKMPTSNRRQHTVHRSILRFLHFILAPKCYVAARKGPCAGPLHAAAAYAAIQKSLAFFASLAASTSALASSNVQGSPTCSPPLLFFTRNSSGMGSM